MQIRTLLVAFTIGAAALFSNTAFAAPCAGPSPFTDVPQGAIYCSDAEWLKNRAITIGCTSNTVYCPNDVVTRASMALFMQRLGTALSPEILRTDTSTGAIALDFPAPIIVCQTGDFTPTFPRRALINTTLAGLATDALEYQHDIYVSKDSGATWSFITANINRSGTSAAHWISSTMDFVVDLTPGTTYRYALVVARQGGTGNFSSTRCFINFMIFNRTGASSPFDAELPVNRTDY